MWADKDTNADYLNFSEVAEVCAEILTQDTLLPISLGVYGGWGAGKSTVLRLIQSEIQKGHNGGRETTIIEFDAWLYQDFDDARAALIDVITSELVQRAEESEGLVDKAKSLARRVDYFRTAGLLTDLGLAATTGVPPFLISRLFGIGQSKADKKEIKAPASDDTEDNEEFDAKEALKSATGLIKPEEVKSPPKEITKFREEFGSLLEELKITLVVFIDNLDRCLPKKAIQTLEAVRQFLFLPSTAFVIAADEDMIRHAVKEHYAGPDERLVTDYLDKMVQVSFRVPRVGVQELKSYMMLLFAESAGVEGERFEKLRSLLINELRELWKGNGVSVENASALLGLSENDQLMGEFDLAHRLAPILADAPSVSGNPRIVKRLLNTIRLRSSISKRRGMAIDDALITKLAVLERCTSDRAFSEFCHLVTTSTDGKPKFVELLEAPSDGGDRLDLDLPEALGAYSNFLYSWRQLEPKLSGRDLRACIYLSRDAAPLRIANPELSKGASDAVDELLRVTKSVSPSGKKAAKNLSNEDAPRAMDELLSAVRKADNWTKRPAGFVGAFLVAEEHPQTRSALSLFIKQLSLKPYPPWLKQLVNSRSWLQ